MKKAGTGFLNKLAALLLMAALIYVGINNQGKMESSEHQVKSISLFNAETAEQLQSVQNKSLLDKILEGISKALFGIDMRDPENILTFHFPESETGNSTDTEGDILFEMEQEELPQDIVLEMERLQKEVETAPTPKPNSTANPNKPSILIYHTHTDEAFLKGEKDAYKESGTGRTMNQDYSIVKVGGVLQNELVKAGYTTYHDKTDNTVNGLKKAYGTSLQTITKYKDKCNVFIDMHRDAYVENGKPNYVTINGVKVAQIMFVVGTGEGGNGVAYNPRPNWKENYKLAVAITNKINELYPGLCKPVYVRTARFNQHMSDQCLLSEIGNERNTLEESKQAAVYLAEAIDKVLSSK